MQQSAGRRRPSPVAVAVARGAVLLATYSAAVAGCGRADTAPSVASVRAAVVPPVVAPGSPVEVTYRFTMKPEAAMAGDYRVFVHVAHANGQRLWADDHEPPIPTSRWKAGQTVEYTRTRFVPSLAVAGEASVRMGLYNEIERLPLEGPEAEDRSSMERSYRVASLKLEAAAENNFLIYTRGWHPDEFSPQDSAVSWKWTTGSAVLSIRNPKKDAMLFLEFAGRPDLFPDGPQQVTVTAGDSVLDRFPADSADRRLRRIPVTAGQLGSDELTEVRIDVDRTVVPAERAGAGQDTRELGIQVYHAYVQSR